LWARVPHSPTPAYPYNCYDVTELLHGGENAIALHVYYSGLFNIYLISADNLSGMIAQLEIEYEDGDQDMITSDRSWKCRECEAYSPAFIYGYQTQFSEDIDMSKLCVGWKSSEYDDSSWDRSQVVSYSAPSDYHFVPQITPPVSYEKIAPVKIKKFQESWE